MLFLAIIAAPILTFNFKEDTESLIDNRKLAGNPFLEENLSQGGDLSDQIENYVNDRIGFRDDMILAYTILNDKLFHKMVHPSYTYGKDGYVFGAGLTVDNPYSEYHEAFADMVKKIQDYCDARNIPFLFAFNPAKPAVLTEYIPAGTNYDRAWVDSFLAALDERDVNYIDNTLLLREKTKEGEAVFNQKYDANHWNDLGAYYGTNAMLKTLKNDSPKIHVNTLEELTISKTLQTSLLVSEFPINEWIPAISIDMTLNTDNCLKYDEELIRHPSYRGFGYFVNEERASEGAPKALVFQGSYMNGLGSKYLANGFSEYIYVHDYQNVIDFPYYFNIFQPDCVIFEVAEYTINNNYFDYDHMRTMELNPVLQDVFEDCIKEERQSIGEDSISVERGETLTKIQWLCDEPADYAWLKVDIEYDMKRVGNGYEVTIPTEVYDQNMDGFCIITTHEGIVTIFSFH